MILTDEPLLAEIERLRAENRALRALVRQERREALAASPTGRITYERSAPYRWPIPQLEVGGAFFVPDQKLLGTLRTSACYWQRKHQGKRFSTLRVKVNGVKGIKVVRWA